MPEYHVCCSTCARLGLDGEDVPSHEGISSSLTLATLLKVLHERDYPGHDVECGRIA